MGRLFVFLQLLVLSLASFLVASDAHLTKGDGVAGVFLLTEGGKYTFNFTEARDACMLLNVTIATRAQMERAVKQGLETCKFGWTAEQVGVIPRLTADVKCGKGKTGVVRWAASTDNKFGVFCFNASDLVETPNRSTSSPQSFMSSTQQTAVTLPSSPTSLLLTLPTKYAVTRKTLTATTAPLQVSTRIPSTHVPASPSKPTVLTFVFSTSVHTADISTSPESVTQPGLDPTNTSPRDGLTALIVLGVIFLLLAAAGVVWYYKLNIFTFLWFQPQQKDDVETEMWKHTDSEMDLQSGHEGEEEKETDRKYSSDITLCVKPETQMDSSE